MPRSAANQRRVALLSPKKLALFKQRVGGKSSMAGDAPSPQGAAIPRRPPGAAPPLSLAQERLWYFCQQHPTSILHNLHHAVALEGALDVHALVRAGCEIVRRHEALRTHFTGDHSPQATVSPLPKLPWKQVDLRAVHPAKHHEEMMQRLGVEGQRPFDLSQGPLLRAVLFERSNDQHILVLFFHHLVIDGWSLGLFLHELATLYEAFARNAPSPLAAPPLQYGDFAAWQRRHLGEAHQRHLAFWKERLAGCPQQSTFFSARTRPTGPRRTGASHQTVLPHHLARGLEELARQHQSTLFMALLAAFSLLLNRRSGQEDLVLGTPTAGRSHEMLQGLLGFFVNILVLRLDLAENPTFSELLTRVRTTTLEAFDHQDIPFESLLTSLGKNLSHDPAPPLVQVTFNLPTVGAGTDPAIEADDVMFNPLFTHDVGTEFDLSLYAVPGPEGLRLHFAYDPNLFTPQYIGLLAEELHRLLERVVAAPQRRLSEYNLSEST